jgi:dTDP-4-dehydrorhamnose reductase
VAEAVVHLLEIEGGGIFHYSSLKGGTKYEWALELADLAGLSMEHITPNREGSATRAVRPRNTQLAVEKIRHTGLSRFTPFREAVQSMLEGATDHHLMHKRR